MTAPDHIYLWVPGSPLPEPRARATATKKGARVYADRSADGWKLAIRRVVMDQLKEQGVLDSPVYTPDEPLMVSWQFYIPHEESALSKALWPYPMSKQQGDLDNLIKAAQDALSPWRRSGETMRGILFSEDAQIVGYRDTWKRWAVEHDAGMVVSVWRLDE